MSNTSIPIVLSVLTFLATAGLIGLSLGAALWARFAGKPALARNSLLLSAGVVGLYLATLVVAAGVSEDHVVPAGSEKYFCELDCHLAYAVTGVGGVSAESGGGVMVTLRTRFDETTISARRGTAAPTWPGPRTVAIVGSDGVRYAAVEVPTPESTPLNRELRPGEAYNTLLKAALPAGVTPASLAVEDGMTVSPLLIGNERSPWHGRTLLALPAPSPS